MDNGLADIVLGATAGAFSPLALLAAWQMLQRTKTAHTD